jgi:hypothetical protein
VKSVSSIVVLALRARRDGSWDKPELRKHKLFVCFQMFLTKLNSELLDFVMWRTAKRDAQMGVTEPVEVVRVLEFSVQEVFLFWCFGVFCNDRVLANSLSATV